MKGISTISKDLDTNVNFKKDKISVYAFCTSDYLEHYADAAQSLRNYYQKYDINFQVFTQEDKPIGDVFRRLRKHNYKELALYPWHSAVVARMTLFPMFLETDSDYFILQDLDMLVMRPDWDIREKINHPFVSVYRKDSMFDPVHKARWAQSINAQKYINTKNILARSAPGDWGDPYAFHKVCADLMFFSRETVENIVKFFADQNCNFMDEVSFNQYAKEVCYRASLMNLPAEDHKVNGLQEEDFIAAYIERTGDTPFDIRKIENLKRDIWHCHSKNEDMSWRWATAQITDMLLHDREYIFAHFGSSDRVWFKNMAQYIKC